MDEVIEEVLHNVVEINRFDINWFFFFFFLIDERGIFKSSNDIQVNNIQVTAETENGDQDVLVSSSSRLMSSAKSPVVHATDECDFEKYVYSGHFSCKSLHDTAHTSVMPLQDVLYKEDSKSLKPDLPSIGFSDFDTSRCLFSLPEHAETSVGTYPCKDNTCLQQPTAEDENCRLKLLDLNTDDSNDTCPKQYQEEVSSDSDITNFKDSDNTTSISSSYPIQTRSSSGRKSSLYRTSLSSYVPVSRQIGEIKYFREIHPETENLSKDEKKQVTEGEWLEPEQQETDDGHVDFSEFEDICVTDNEDESHLTEQNIKDVSYCRNNEESHYSNNIAEYMIAVENPTSLTLEETNIALNDYARENSDWQELVENMNFPKEGGNTYSDCHKNKTYYMYSENMKENCLLKRITKNSYYKAEKDHANSGKVMLKSEYSNENAKTTEKDSSLQDYRNTIKSENFKENGTYLNGDVHGALENVKEKADAQNKQEKMTLANVKESSFFWKVKVDKYSQSLIGKANMYVRKDANCHLHKENYGFPTNLGQQTRQNEDKSVHGGEEPFNFANTNVLDTDRYKFDTCEIEDTSRTSCCAIRDHTQIKEDVNAVSPKIKCVKEADTKGNETTEETELLSECIEEVCKANEEDDKTSIPDENKTVVDDGNVQIMYVGNMQNDTHSEKPETMIVKDTLVVDIALCCETAGGNVGDKPTPLKILVQKTELKRHSEWILTAIKILGCSISFLHTFNLKAGLLVTWKMRKSTFSIAMKNGTAGEKTVIEERTYFCKNHPKVLDMILMYTNSMEDDVTWTNKRYIESNDISSILLNESQQSSRQDSLLDEKIALESKEMDCKCHTQENGHVEDRSLIILNDQKRNIKQKDAQITILSRQKEVMKLHVGLPEDFKVSEVSCNCEQNSLKVKNSLKSSTEERYAYSHSCFWHTNTFNTREHELETRKEDFIEEQKSDSFAVQDNEEDGQSQPQPVAKQKIGHIEADITREMVKCAVGCTEPCFSSDFKMDSEERNPNYVITDCDIARCPDSQVNDHSEKRINEFVAKPRDQLRNECYVRQNSPVGHQMTKLFVDYGLKVFSYHKSDKSVGFQKMHRNTSRMKRFSDLPVDEESVSSILNPAKLNRKDYRYTTYKAQSRPQTKLTLDGTHSYITGENSFLKPNQKNLSSKSRKVSKSRKKDNFLLQYSNLEKDEKLRSAIQKRRVRHSQCTRKDKSRDGGFGIKHRLLKRSKPENSMSGIKSRISSNELTKQSTGITWKKSCASNLRNMSEVGEKSDSDEVPSYESSRNDTFVQDLRPELDQVGWQTLGESIDSGFGTIESFRSDVILEMEKMEHTFYNGKVKPSSKKLRKLKGKLRKKERKIKKELSADYINAILNPLYFRPELSSVVVYPGLQRYFERLQEGPLSQEESLSYEWLRLESLRNYDGAGSIIQLARGGFYHDPVDGPLSTRCYACNVLYTNWEYFDNVTEVHRRLSPNCPHLRGNASVSGNVSIDNGPPNRAESSVSAETPEGTAGPPSVTTVSSITDSLRGTQIRDMVSQ